MTTPHKHPHHDEHHHNHSHKNHDHASGNLFLFPFLLTLAFAVIELIGGIFTQSLALQGDAWHMFSDVFALGLAMYAAHHATKLGSKKHVSGQSHAEIIASIINAVLMCIVVVYIVLEALYRLKNPHNVTGGYVMFIAFIGMVVNIIVAKKLHSDEAGHSNHNHRAALIHVMGDLLGSVAALVAGAVIYFTGWLAIDALLSIFISLLILLVTLKLIKDIWHTLQHSSENAP